MAEPMLLAHWCKLIENFEYSPKEFYSLVEGALEFRKIPGLQKGRVPLAEGGILSAKREYLRLTRENLLFDICGAPFGTGFFVSSRLGELPDGCLFALPGLGLILRALFKPQTYHRVDMMMMYQQAVQAAVMDVVDEITKQKGLKPLTELERKPVLTGLLRG